MQKSAHIPEIPTKVTRGGGYFLCSPCSIISCSLDHITSWNYSNLVSQLIWL